MPQQTHIAVPQAGMCCYKTTCTTTHNNSRATTGGRRTTHKAVPREGAAAAADAYPQSQQTTGQRVAVTVHGTATACRWVLIPKAPNNFKDTVSQLCQHAANAAEQLSSPINPVDNQVDSIPLEFWILAVETIAGTVESTPPILPRPALLRT